MKLGPPPTSAESVTFDDVADLRALRHLVMDRAQAAGLAEGRIDDLALAVSELATNSLQHGGGSGVLHVWVMPGEFVMQVSDGGAIESLPSEVGPPTKSSATRGRGLHLVEAVSDLVERASSGNGLVTRVHVRRTSNRAMQDQQ